MWSIFSLLLSVIYVSCAAENVSTNSTKPLLSSRIIGGSAANIADYPYLVAILYLDSFTCGGSLIKWNWILTAAHCTEGTTAEQLKIRAGSKYWKTGGILAGITAIFNNPEYTRETLTHDSALMKTAFSLESYAKTYSIATIGLANSLPDTDTDVNLAGWGRTVTDGETPDEVRAVTLKMLDWGLCASSYGNLDDFMFCAGPWLGGLGFCQGDSGGGLRYGKNLIGIVSYGSTTCAGEYIPGVYCSVPAVLDWILATIQKN